MKLLSSLLSPYVRKVRIAAAMKGVADRIEMVPIDTNVSDNPEINRANPLAKVPALVVGELAIYDSHVICEYLDSLAPAPVLFPKEGAARLKTLTLGALGDGILDAAILVRYETTVRPAELQWKDWVAGQMRKVRGALDALEAERLDGPFDIGRITIACALGYLDFRYQSEAWRTKHRRLAVWADDVAQRKSIQLTVPKDPT